MNAASAHTPSILFICVRNAGKSQMAAALATLRAAQDYPGAPVAIHSAGTDPRGEINGEAAASVAEVGADMSTGHPKPIDRQLLQVAHRIVVIGDKAEVEPVDGMRAAIERWRTDEPSLRGIDGLERMRLIRDDIDARVRVLLDELLGATRRE